MRYAVMTALVLALASAGVVAEEYNKDHDPWARFGVGSFAKFKMVSDMGQMQSEGEMIQTLDEVTETGYTTTAATKATVMGQTHEEEQETSQEFPVFDGNETLTVDGTEYACTIWKQTNRTKGITATARMWLTADGKALKAAADGAQKFEVVATKVSDSVEVAGKLFDCVKLQGKMSQGASDADFTMWMTHDIPGGSAKFEIAMNVQGVNVKMTAEVTEFEAKTASH